MPILTLFILLPLVEIGLFVTVGGWLTLWPTLLLVAASALLGVSVLRRQGMVTAVEVSTALNDMRDPARPLADGALTMLAGVLLVVPGFLTSAIGLLLLVPFIRHAAITHIGRHLRGATVVMRGGGAAPRRADDQTIEGEFHEIEPGKRPTHRPSGWTQH
ncbi:MAG: FxsA family protein [Rhodobacteraceae bacterium]|nr:FxsA family protein [Paracoccaceae bacterium]